MAERRSEAAPTLRQVSDPARDAGKALARAIGDALARDELARLAVPGGSALAALSFARDRLGEGWRRVALTWIDERCVPEADPESNRGAARRLGLLEGPSPARCLTRLVGGDPTLPAHGLPGLEIFTDLSIDPDPAAIQATQPRS